ncbi:MAG TPA: family 16 glycosylhydrolase [Cytophagaceae bacterium]|nr:family 16 glycosylhydrolase [Cytophagaceae bacterium]
MKIQSIFLPFILIVFAVSSSSAQNCWSQVWGDDFNGTSLSTTDWIYDTGTGFDGGWGNNEYEYYTNTTQNVSVSGGYLNLTARYSNNYNGSGKNFTSGRILTRDKHYWKYGRFEASIKLPANTGTWPAFWMLPQSSPYGGWPTSGEIDIMENRGDVINKISGTLHYGNPSPNNKYDSDTYVKSSGNFADGFHLFAVEWEPGEIRFYVDGVLYKTETQTPNSLNPASNNAVTWPWDQDFYIIFNMAIGGWYTNNPAESSITGGNTSWSATMQVDYVKVYTDLSGGELTGSIDGKSSALYQETNLTYSIPATSGATYVWTVDQGTIVSGQGTNAIIVNWGTQSGSVSVSKTISCGSADYTLPVTVMPVSCGVMLEDFENIRFTDYGLINGQLSQKVDNPNSSIENNSPYCAQYVRNASEQYDVLIVANPGLGDADLIENGSKSFMFDVYSNAAGRNIEFTLENSNVSTPSNYPSGRHSTYRATTTKVNAWETLKFAWVASPDAALAGTSVNQLTMLFMPNTYTNTTFYYDNILLTDNSCPLPTTATKDATQNSMNLFPNPATDLVTLQLNNDIHSGQVKIEIFENTGRLLFETAQTVSDDETTLSVSELKAGYYLVKITQGDYSSVKALYKK